MQASRTSTWNASASNSMSPLSARPSTHQVAPLSEGSEKGAALDEASQIRHPFTDAETARQQWQTLLKSARRQLCYHSPDLEPGLYDQPFLIEQLKHFLIASPKRALLVLLQDSRAALAAHHGLLALADRLPSRLTIRRLNPHYPTLSQGFWLADQHSVLIRPKSDDLRGYFCPHNASLAKQTHEAFAQAWQISVTDLNLRSLLL